MLAFDKKLVFSLPLLPFFNIFPGGSSYRKFVRFEYGRAAVISCRPLLEAIVHNREQEGGAVLSCKSEDGLGLTRKLPSRKGCRLASVIFFRVRLKQLNPAKG
jgi:hypothetical protein